MSKLQYCCKRWSPLNDSKRNLASVSFFLKRHSYLNLYTCYHVRTWKYSSAIQRCISKLRLAGCLILHCFFQFQVKKFTQTISTLNNCPIWNQRKYNTTINALNKYFTSGSRDQCVLRTWWARANGKAGCVVRGVHVDQDTVFLKNPCGTREPVVGNRNNWTLKSWHYWFFVEKKNYTHSYLSN